MRNLRDSRMVLPGAVKPGDFPIGSLESRAAARSMMTGLNAAPSICIVVIHSKAPALNPGPITWGSVPGVPELFERGPDESEGAFEDRVMAARRPDVKGPEPAGPGSSLIHLYAQTQKPTFTEWHETCD